MRKLILLPILTFLLTFPAFNQDLIIESLETNESYYSREGFSFSITIKNIGILPTLADNNSLKIHLNNDSTDFSESFYGSVTNFTIPVLEPNESITITQSYEDDDFYNVIRREPGEYYALARIQNNNDSDVNLDNNYFIGDIVNVVTPTTDLSISLNSSLNSTYIQNDLIKASFTATNSGSPIYSSSAAAYLSTDQVLDNEDIFLFDRTGNFPFNYGNEVTTNLIYAIPNSITVGEYYVIYKIDRFERFSEQDEMNNIIITDLIEITESDVQLEITSLTANINDDKVNVDFEIKNNGTSPAKSYNYEIYWSIDGETKGFHASGFFNSSNYGIIEPSTSKIFTKSLFDAERYGEEVYEYIIVTSTDPDYPQIEPVSVWLGPTIIERYNFNISDVYLNSPVETEDTEIPISIEIENPNSNSIYESANVDITLESLDGQIIENYSISEYVSMYEYGTDVLNLSLPNRPTLTAGKYNVTANITLDYESGGAGPFSNEMEILASEYNIEVEVLGQNGDIINQGIVYFYEKTADGTINFLSSKNIEEINGVGKVSFLQSAGNYMFFVVPDENEFPNYIRTVSGNTFKLEEISFTEINSDATIQIEPIYVDPNTLNGSKIIQGNVVAGTASGKMAYNQTAMASFDQTPVYLIQENKVVAFTYTDATGAFSFSNAENGDYDVYFDDGDILESNDITANLSLDESTDIIDLTIDENGEVGIQDLKMEIAAFDLETRDIEADEDNLSIQYNLSNLYKHNSITISDAFFYCYIKQNDVTLDSIAFEKNLTLNENDTLNIKNSLQLTTLLDIGEYEVELYFSTPYQNTEVPGSARTFNVIEPLYNIKAFALDSQQSPVTSGVIQLYKVNGSGQLVLFEEKSVSQDGSASFNTPTCDYIIRVVPQQESYPHLIPSFQNQKYYFTDDDIQTLTAGTEHQINLVNDPSHVLNGKRKVLFNFDDDNFSFNETRVIIANAADSSIIQTAFTEDNQFESKNFESGEYLFFFDDEDISADHEKWYSLVINEQDDLYQIEINSSSTSLNQYDFDFMMKKDSVFTYYNKMSQLNMAFDIDKYSSIYPEELASFDFRIDLISKESTDSLSFFFSEMLDFNTFEDLDKTLLLDSFLDAGMYDVKVYYSSQYTNGFVQNNTFPIEILDAGINLNTVELEQEILENALQIPLKFQLTGSADSLADFKVYYEHKLIKRTDTITIENHQNSIDIGKEEYKTYSYALNLDTGLDLGDYKLITYFNPYQNNKPNQQLVETTFRVKNKRLSLSNLNLNEELSIISDSMNFSFSISANDEDSIKNQNTKLISYLVYESDTLIYNEEDFTLNIPRSGTEEFHISIDLKDDLTSDLNPGDYKLIVELKHPIAIYSEKVDVNIEILDTDINLNKVQLEQELLENALQIPMQFQLKGSSDSLADFKVYYEHKLIKGTDTITIQNHQNIIDIGKEEYKTYSYTLNLDTGLELGDYKLITYFNPYHNNKSKQQLVETTFRVKNKRLSLSNLSLNEELSIISDLMNFNFNISANNEDSIKNQNIKLISYLIYENDTLIHNEEGFTLNIPRSSTEEFQMSIDLKDKLTSDLNPGDYKLIVELKHPIAIYSEKLDVNFRVKDPSIELLEVIIPDEISGKTNEIVCEIKVLGNRNDIIRSLQTDFKLTLINKDNILSDTIITKDLTIQKSGSISINIPISFASTLEDGEYLFELSYITKYMNNYSATISDDFTVFTESEITSNKDELIPEYSIYPNPFANQIKIKGDFDDALLYNQHGKLIKAYHEETGFQNLSDISAGVYLLIIEYQGKMVYKKVIKK